MPREDVGPAGVDKGKGGKYLVLPPGHPDKTPDGYIVLTFANYQGYALLRSILQSGGEADVAKALAYARRIKIDPLLRAGDPPRRAWLCAPSLEDVVQMTQAVVPPGQIVEQIRSRVSCTR